MRRAIEADFFALNVLLPQHLTSSTREKTENHCSRKMIRAFVRSYGESSTETLSPGTMRMKCFRILPDTCASTLRWPGRSTRNIVPGSTCVTVPSATIGPSFAIAGEYMRERAALKDGTMWRRQSCLRGLRRQDCLRHDFSATDPLKP